MAKVTPSARFRDWVYLDKPDGQPDAATGEETEAYQQVGRVRGAVTPLSSRELVRAQASEVQTTHRVILRYRADVDSTWRVRWADPRGPGGTRCGRILGILETVRRRELELSVVEVTGG